MPDDTNGDTVIWGWEISDRPGARLCVGYLPGRSRPALWIEDRSAGRAILAHFNGPKHVQAAVNFLDAMADQINRVIEFYQSNQHNQGDDPNDHESSPD
jgi:hypothetical protein